MAVTYETDVTGMETTQYYKLYKPGYDNVADVNVLNINADLIDAILHDHESLIDDIQDRTVDGIKIDKNTNIKHYVVCNTEAETVVKTVSVNNFKLSEGALVIVKFNVTNTAVAPMLNVSGSGAKEIKYRGSAISADYLQEGRTYVFVYDGTSYQLVGDINTDTHWTTQLYVGFGEAANAATTNGNTKLTVADNTIARNSITLKGSGATTVTSDANGNVTISSTDNNTTYKNFVKSGSTAAAGLVPKPSTTAGTTKYLREDCTWQVPPNTNNISASSVAANGYIKFNNGLIIQWGKETSGAASVTFPIAFTSAIYAITATENGDSGHRGGVRLFAIPNGLTKFTAKSCCSNDGELYSGWKRESNSKNMIVGWIAIGK